MLHDLRKAGHWNDIWDGSNKLLVVIQRADTAQLFMTENVQCLDWIRCRFQFLCRYSKCLTTQVLPQMILIAKCIPFTTNTGSLCESCSIAIRENTGNDIIHNNNGRQILSLLFRRRHSCKAVVD